MIVSPETPPPGSEARDTSGDKEGYRLRGGSWHRQMEVLAAWIRREDKKTNKKEKPWKIRAPSDARHDADDSSLHSSAPRQRSSNLVYEIICVTEVVVVGGAGFQLVQGNRHISIKASRTISSTPRNAYSLSKKKKIIRHFPDAIS